MRVLLAAVGTRGDVEPFALLARALAARGHGVTLALDAGFFDTLDLPGVERCAIGFHTMADHARIVRHAFSGPTPDIRTQWAFTGFFVNRREALAARLAELDHAGFELLVLPACLLFPQVVTPGVFRARWRTPTAVALVTPPLEREYREIATLPVLPLAALSRRFAPDDPHIRAAWQFTGFWIDRDVAPLSPAVEAFLAAGAAPIFFGMGSALGFDAPRLARMVLAAARAAGARVIVERGWIDMAAQGEDVLVVDDTPFASLFPRCAAVFTHGGTGRVAEALHAGVPIATLPMVNDQVRWTAELTARGVGLGWVDPFAPRPEVLAKLVERALGDDAVRRAARAFADELRDEAGITAACDAIERYVSPS